MGTASKVPTAPGLLALSTEQELRAELEQAHVCSEVRFQTYLVPVKRFGRKRLAEDSEGTLETSGAFRDA